MQNYQKIDQTLTLFDPARILECFVNDPLQLTIGTTEFIRRPLLHRLQCVRIKPEDKWLFLSHRFPVEVVP